MTNRGSCGTGCPAPSCWAPQRHPGARLAGAYVVELRRPGVGGVEEHFRSTEPVARRIVLDGRQVGHQGIARPGVGFPHPAAAVVAERGGKLEDVWLAVHGLGPDDLASAVQHDILETAVAALGSADQQARPRSGQAILGLAHGHPAGVNARAENDLRRLVPAQHQFQRLRQAVHGLQGAGLAGVVTLGGHVHGKGPQRLRPQQEQHPNRDRQEEQAKQHLFMIATALDKCHRRRGSATRTANSVRRSGIHPVALFLDLLGTRAGAAGTMSYAWIRW